MPRPTSRMRSAVTRDRRHQRSVHPDSSVSSAGLAATTHLMASGSQLALPRLDGAPVEYLFRAGDGISIAAALVLLELDIATPEDWERAKHDPTAFVLATLDHWIVAHGGDAIRKRFDLYAALTDCVDEYSEASEADRERDRLYMTLDPGKAGYVILGPTLELLSETDSRLPATFFQFFTGALNSWVRVYDYRDAEERVEVLREWIEGEQDADQYEIPDVAGCIPAAVKQRPMGRTRLGRLKRRLKKGQAKTLVDGALELSQLSMQATRPQVTEEVREQLMDSNPPLPALLAVFTSEDAIEGCFDDEAQGMMEVTPEPNLVVPVDARDPKSVRAAFAILGVVCDTLAAASRLMDHMPGNELRA